MKLQTPRWWYRRDGAPAPLTRALLRPVSWIWAAATARRLARTAPFDPGVPVVSIGNLTMGGSGKTPLAAAVAARLRARGVDACVLSRGHGGRLRGPVRVDPAVHAAIDVGDEPLMLARAAPVFIARDRAAGARRAATAGAQALVLDDAHQNPSLAKTLSILAVDGETREGEWPFGDGAVFPAGPMREPFATGLARADAVVVILPGDAPAVDPELLDVLASKPVLVARLQPTTPPPAGPLVGFAGVAKPWRVEAALKASGADLKDFAPFPDHHPYTDDDQRFLEGWAEQFGATLVTTEKDWVRLPASFRGRVAAWPVSLVLEDDDALDDLLADVVRRSRPNAP